MAPIFVIIRTAIAVLALFLVGHFIIQCGTVPSNGDTCPARSPASAFLASTSATGNSSTSASGNNHCDANYSFSFAQVGAFIFALVLVVQIGQAIRSHPTAVRREGTLSDLIWSCQLFLCRWTITALAIPAAHYIVEKFPCSLTENLEHPFGRPMEWLFVALVWFAIVAMLFECNCLGKSARHLDLLDALHGWSGPSSDNHSLAPASGLAIRIQTIPSSAASNRGGHEMMVPNIDWYKVRKEEVEMIKAARRSSSISSALGNGLVLTILVLGTMWDVSTIHSSIGPCAVDTSHHSAASKAILISSVSAATGASTVATWVRSGGQQYILFHFLMMAGWFIVALHLELRYA